MYKNKMSDNCQSETMASKLLELNALLQMVRRTLDSPDASIYIDEVVRLMNTASEMTVECEHIRQYMDTLIYQQNSKFYAKFNPSSAS